MSVKNFGVPLSNGTRGSILQPLVKYKFRVTNCHNSVTSNTLKVNLNFVEKIITLQVRANILAEDFQDAYNFVKSANLTVEVLDGACKPIFVNQFTGIKVLDHSLDFDYSESGYCTHVYKISFRDMISLPIESFEVGEAPEQESDPSFPSVAEAMAKFDGRNKVTGDSEELNDGTLRQDAGC